MQQARRLKINKFFAGGASAVSGSVDMDALKEQPVDS
jgi:hypothetical protein